MTAIKEVPKVEENYPKLAGMMKALSDETRTKILSMLSENELCACMILKEFDITQPTLSYHMKVLCDSGLVNYRQDGIWMKYTVNIENLMIMKELLDEMLKRSKQQRMGNNDECFKLAE